MEIIKDKQFFQHFEYNLLKNKNISSWELFKMTYNCKQKTHITNFSELATLKHIKINPLPHQIETCKNVILKMHGRAILADEVGLGKTIEAGLILKEYLLRGLVKNALILVPASLVSQWVYELRTKFFINAVSYKKNYDWNEIDIVICSIDTAKQKKHRQVIEQIEYDLLIVDEAHKLKNKQTQNYKFVKNIKKKYCLLLTATPVQNDLKELYSLISILKPGLLGLIKSVSKKKKNEQKYVSFIQKQLRQIMIRNKREETRLNNSSRKINSIIVEFSKEERTLYQFLENNLQNVSTLAKITYLRELCSSKEAFYLSLKKMNENIFSESHKKYLLKLLQNISTHAKGNKLVEIVKNIGDEKIIIFTEYRGTQLYLQWLLQQHGISSVPFRGGFSSNKKEWMRDIFKKRAQVLIATEAAGEGINLQFCNHLINYDLPWNPMRLEQRIGRIHRFGQKQDVTIYNFAIQNTVEETILKQLYKKINLFESVIGKLNDILSEKNRFNFDDEIKEIMEKSTWDDSLTNYLTK